MRKHVKESLRFGSVQCRTRKCLTDVGFGCDLWIESIESFAMDRCVRTLWGESKVERGGMYVLVVWLAIV